VHNPEECASALERTKSVGGAFTRSRSRASSVTPSPGPSPGLSPVISATGKILQMPKLPAQGGTLKKEHEITAKPMSRVDRTLLGDAYLKGFRKHAQPPPGPAGENKHPLLHLLASSPTLGHQNPASRSPPSGGNSRSFGCDSTDGFGRPILPCDVMDHLKAHGTGLSNSKEQYQAVRDTIEEAFQDVDLDKNGVIDKFELGHLLSKIAPLEHPIDDLDAIFDDVDTDRNGVIDPQEFRSYLEATLTVVENRQMPIDLFTLVRTAFRGGFQRVRKERNIITKAFLEASEMLGCNPSGARTANKTSWIFKMYDRLHSDHVDSRMVEEGRSGRLAFLEELLREVVSLGEVILAPIDSECPNREKLRKSAAEKFEKIKRALFGTEKRQEIPNSMADVIGFCSEWLNKLSETESEQAGLGRLASDWRTSSLDALSSSPEAIVSEAAGGRSLDTLRPIASSSLTPPSALKFPARRSSLGGLGSLVARTLESPPGKPDRKAMTFDAGSQEFGNPPTDAMFDFRRNVTFDR